MGHYQVIVQIKVDGQWTEYGRDTAESPDEAIDMLAAVNRRDYEARAMVEYWHELGETRRETVYYGDWQPIAKPMQVTFARHRATRFMRYCDAQVMAENWTVRNPGDTFKVAPEQDASGSTYCVVRIYRPVLSRGAADAFLGWLSL